MLRFRPDAVIIKKGLFSILCEIKTESGKYRNFAIEIDSFKAALIWERIAVKSVAFIFMDIKAMSAVAIWANQLPPPECIYIPQRFDFAKQIERINLMFPLVESKSVIYNNGSGTPYMLVPKNYEYFIELEKFIVEKLITKNLCP